MFDQDYKSDVLLEESHSNTAASPDDLPQIGRAKGNCRFCDTPLKYTFVDLGLSPLCENWLTLDNLREEEAFYPLHAFVCEECFLVQVEEYVSGREIFAGEYGYFSSFSTSWLEHAKKYVNQIVPRLGLDGDSFVVELASNDGYLLRHMHERGIPHLGIEPAENCAAAARELGVNTVSKYFGLQVAKELSEAGPRADLLIANNVLAHVPDLNDFVAGMKHLLADDGVITVEFPQLARIMAENQFDTIYQEHYCYFSFHTVERIFAHHGLTIFDVDTLSTHGGSLRIYARHENDASKPVADAVGHCRQDDFDAGLVELSTYRAFADRVIDTKNNLVEFLIQARREGKSVVGYGAPGKGTTLLNYCGVRTDLVEYLVDRNPYKHERYMPGVRIPIHAPEKISETRPDIILVLPWNLKDEIVEQLAYTREWGAKIVVPIPEMLEC